MTSPKVTAANKIVAYISGADIIDLTWYDAGGEIVDSTYESEYELYPESEPNTVLKFAWMYDGGLGSKNITYQDCLDAEIIGNTIRFKGKCALDLYKQTPYHFSERS